MAIPVIHPLYAYDCTLFLENATGVIKRKELKTTPFPYYLPFSLLLTIGASGQLVNFTLYKVTF